MWFSVRSSDSTGADGVSQRRKGYYAAFILAAPLTVIVVYAATRPFLPAEIADMNNMPILRDDPRSPESVLVVAEIQSLIAAVVALVALWRTQPRAGLASYGRWAVYYAWFVSGFASATLL